MNQKNKAKLSLIFAMTLFGTIGIFRRSITLSSESLAFFRGLIGTLFLLCYVTVKKIPVSYKEISKNLFLLVVSGMMIGLNWLLLFESYKYTSVATATLCYYLAPVFVIIASTFLFKEKLTFKNIVCILIAFIGMIFVSGIFESGLSFFKESKGILYGISAAVLYASVVLCNKKITSINPFSKTIVQLASSTLVMLIYILFTGKFTLSNINGTSLILTLIVGIVHTGIAYTLYFGSIEHLSAQTLSIYSYIDPVIAIVLSVLILQEGMTLFSIIGAILILSASAFNEFSIKRKK